VFILIEDKEITEIKKTEKNINEETLAQAEKDTRVLKVVKYFDDILDLEKKIEKTVERLQKMNSMNELQFYPQIDIRRLCMNLKHIQDSIEQTHRNLRKLFRETEDMFFPSKKRQFIKILKRRNK
jgi:hypothetical protein